jgi:23S rRNA (guanosine2251-2'-O)-methyltransferase
VKRSGGFDHSKFDRGNDRGGKPQGGGKDFGGGKARGDFKTRGEGAPAPRGERTQGNAGFAPRGEGSFQDRNARQASFGGGERSSFKPRSEGGFAPRGAEPRSEGGFAARQGRFVPGNNRPQGDSQDRGGFKPRSEGGFAPRQDPFPARGAHGKGTGLPPAPQASTGSQDRGSYRPRTEGGFSPRQDRFQADPTQNRGSYQNRAARNENYGFPDSERWAPAVDGHRQQQEDREWQARQSGQRYEPRPAQAPAPRERDTDMDGYRSRNKSRGPEPKAWTPTDGESGIVAGLHAVEGLLDNQSGRVQRLLLLRGSNSPELHKLQAKAEDLGIPCQQLEQRQMDIKGEGHRHGGVIALCNARDYTEWGPLRRILLEDVEEGGNPIVIMGAAIEDPRNLGAIIRSAVGLGAKALILPKKGGCGLTGIVDETSAGALSCLPVSRPADIEAVLKDLASKGFAIVGLDASGELPEKCDLKGPMVLVAGGEDRGLPPHLRRPCTTLLRLPMDERLQSYNTSVAASLALYEAVRQRGGLS